MVGPLLDDRDGRCRFRCDTLLMIWLLYVGKYVSDSTYIGVIGSGRRFGSWPVLLGMRR